MLIAQLVLGPPNASPRSTLRSPQLDQFQLQGLRPTPRHEVDGWPPSDIVRADGNVLGLPSEFPVVSSRRSRLGFGAILREHVAHLVRGSGVWLQSDTRPTGTYL